MRYERERGSCDLLRVELDAGDAVMAEVGNLLFARGAAEWDVTLPGRGFAGKVAAGFKRKMSGGAVVMTTCAGPGLFRH